LQKICLIKMILKMEIKNNELLRHFEYKDETGKIVVEYVNQEKKIFLTKLSYSEDLKEEIINEFLKKVMNTIENENLKMVTSHPKIVSFIKKNPIYKNLLPVGIRI